MSKKCCGIIYNENEKFCTMCGKSLKDLPDYEEQIQNQDESKGNEESKSEEALTEKTPEVLDMAEVDRIAASVLGEKGAQATEEKEEKITDQAEEQVEEQLEEQAKEQDDVQAKAEVEVEEDEDDEEEEEDDGTASAGLKFFGTLIILLMLASIAAVGLGVYFIMLNPFYKNHDINDPVVYEQMATDTDVTNIVSRPPLTPVSIETATQTDADIEEAATETDATETDASGDDESEDME